MLRSLLKANVAVLLGLGAMKKVLAYYIHTTLHICNNSTGFAFASAMNRSDYILNISLYFYNTTVV